MFDNTVVGSVVTGLYKRAGRPSNEVALEITALAVLPVQGRAVGYLVGTRLNGSQAGSVVMMRASCFNPASVSIVKAEKYEPVDLSAYYVVTGDQSGAFAPLEKVDPKDADWAIALGGRKLTDYLVK